MYTNVSQSNYDVKMEKKIVFAYLLPACLLDTTTTNH